MEDRLITPVLLIVFNRPEKTRLVIQELKKQKPVNLFIHGDGPRKENDEDRDKIEEIRQLIDHEIDWHCNLRTSFPEENYGCGKGPFRAISWFFENVEEGIIIEDDCIPHPDFFKYCSILLERYRNNKQVMIVGATTYHDDYPCEQSYTFTVYGTMAAWATWKRVWDNYDYYLSYINRKELKKKLRKIFYSRFEVKNWMGLYDWMVEDGFSDYWDWQLHFQLFMSEGLAIRPAKNLISNIGTGADATHTTYETAGNFTANREVFPILPLTHPPEVISDKKIDSVYYRQMYHMPSVKKLKLVIARTIKLFQTGKKN